MDSKLMMAKTIFMFFLGITFGSVVGTFYLGREKSPMYYGIGFIVILIFIAITMYFYRKHKKIEKMIKLKEEWPYGENEKRDFKRIENFFEKFHPEELKEKDYYILDDQSASDLDLKDVFSKIDVAITTAGQQILYYILRTPKTKVQELLKRDKIIEEFRENDTLREESQVALLSLGKQRKGNIISLFNSKTNIVQAKKYIYKLAALLPIVALIMFFFIGAKALLFLFGSFALNSSINYKSEKQIEDEVSSIAYAASLITCAKGLNKVKSNGALLEHQNILKENIKYFNVIERKATYLMASEGADVFIEYINVLFLTKIRGYYDIIDTIQQNRDKLIEVYKTVGEIDALISIASYRERLEYYCKPNFVDEKKKLSIVEGVHPLIEDAVSNGLSLDRKGVILTGSNMAGKSTFLRMLGINALFAQTIYTVVAKEYSASLLRVITSLSVSDDVNTGTSYYLGECEALLRILNSIDEDITGLCMVDEIFRGTNPIERIASAREIIKYIIDKNAIPLVATHDIELTEVSKEKYECYYFCEDVDEQEGLVFDYKLKNGVCKSGNAIKLLKYLGYPKVITDNATMESEKALN